MKTTKTMLRTGLVGLFLIGLAYTAFAQTIDKTPEGAPVNVGPGTAVDNVGRVSTFNIDDISTTNEERDVILFYNPGTSGPRITLTASRTEDLSNITPAPSRDPSPFTHYRWSYWGQDNAGAVDGTTFSPGLTDEGILKEFIAAGDNQLPLTELSEGYHYFKVKGIVNPLGLDDEELCETQEETFVVYVLPRLEVSPVASSNLSNPSIFQYCEIEANPANPTEGQKRVSIATAYDFVDPSVLPGVTDFEVKYRHYAVKQNADGTYPDAADAENDPDDIAGISILEESTDNATGGTLPIFYPQMADIGTYKILTEMEYVVKDRQYNLTDGATRVRDYVIYRSLAKSPDGLTDVEITVTPKPGKPHITIEGVDD